MTARPKPPEEYDDNPPLDADFFARACPATPGEAARLREALKRIVEPRDKDRSLDDEIAHVRRLLMDM